MIEEDDMTKEGIVVPNVNTRVKHGKVVAVGDGRIDGNQVEMTVKEGDRVLFGKGRSVEISIGGETLYVAKLSEVHAVITMEESKSACRVDCQ